MSQGELRDLAALASIVSATVESYQPEEVMRTALERLVEVLDMDIGVVHLVEGDQLVLGAQLHLSPETQQELASFPLSEDRFTTSSLRQNRPIVLDGTMDAYADSRASITRESMKALAAVPIPGPGGPVGVLVVGSNRPRTICDSHIILLQAATNQVGVALEHARLVERLERQVEKVQEQLVLRERLATLGQLAGSLGHELRGPLVNLQMALGLLEGADDSMRADLVSRMGRELLRCHSVINDLLDYTRSREPARVSTNLAAIMHQAARVLSGEPEITIEVRAEEVDRAQVDPDQVLRLLENLLNNASQAMSGRGKILMALSPEESGLVLRVEDSGPGVAPEQRDRIFEPLVTTRRGGTGLGLAVCRRTMDSHGGTIGVEDSAELGGASFVLRFPRAR